MNPRLLRRDRSPGRRKGRFKELEAPKRAAVSLDVKESAFTAAVVR